jgi:predicted permease
MSTVRAWVARLGGLLGKERRDRELAEELESHVQMHIDDNLRSGMAPEEARRRALLKLGGIDQTKERYRDRRGIPSLEARLQDIRFGLRMLRRNPAFTAVAVVTLSLGIGANAIIFSMVNGFLLRPLPVLHPEQIAALAIEQKDVPLGASGFSYSEFIDFRNQNDTFSEIFGNVLSTVALGADGRTDQLPICYVSANFFSALGLRPTVGRLIQPSDGEGFGQSSYIVLGYTFWQKRFGGDPGIVGKQVRVNGREATIIGVASKEFRGMFSPFEVDGYLPMGAVLAEEGLSQFSLARGHGRVLAFGRLKPGMSIPEAQNSLDVIALRLARRYPATDAGIRVRAIPEKLARPQPYANEIFIVIGALFLVFAGLVLLLACINVANVVLARALIRQREMAVRAALGAGRGRLISQMLTETLLLAVFGGASGLVLAEVANRLAPSVHFPGFPLRLDFAFDWRVYTYALATVAFAGIVSGLPPALRASRADVNSVLRDDGLSRGIGEKHRLHSDLVVAQIACSLTLLVTAGLFVRSLRHIEGTYLGFDPEHVLNVTLDPSQDGYDYARTVEFYRELYERVRALPGVQSASFAASVPMGSFPSRASIFGDFQPADPDQQPPSVLYNMIDPGYLETMRVSLLRGRDFTDADGEIAPSVAIVNETMARKFWPGKVPIGERFRMRSAAGRVVEVVGIAQDGKYQTVAEDFQPYFYVPLAQNYAPRRVLEIRSGVSLETLAPQVQREIHGIAPDVTIVDLRTMKQSLEGGTGYFAFRLGAFLAVQMGFVGLILAVVGVYGVVSFTVSRRTREIGIRVALGANSPEILVLVLRRGIGLIGVGVAAGLIASWALGHTISHVLAGVSATDPLIYAIATATLSFVALVACWIPARRATRVDPMVALRYE